MTRFGTFRNIQKRSETQFFLFSVLITNTIRINNVLKFKTFNKTKNLVIPQNFGKFSVLRSNYNEK